MYETTNHNVPGNFFLGTTLIFAKSITFLHKNKQFFFHFKV